MYIMYTNVIYKCIQPPYIQLCARILKVSPGPIQHTPKYQTFQQCHNYRVRGQSEEPEEH